MKKALLIILTLTFWSFASLQGAGLLTNDDFLSGIPAEISVFPNPATDVVYLQVNADLDQIFELKVVNLIGQTLLEDKISTNRRTEIDLRAFPPGVYFLQIVDGDNKIMKRLVIQ